MAPNPEARSDLDIRERILDAASRCLEQGGFGSDRLMSAIAREAGLSRQPLYKHFGSIEAIRAALVQRELDRFLLAFAPRVAEIEWSPDFIVESVSYAVEYARSLPLLRAAMRDVPDLLLPWMTTNAEISIGYVDAILRPLLESKVDDGTLPPLDLDIVIDLLSRITLSMIFTSSPLDVDDPAALRRYLRTAIGLAVNAQTSGRGAR